MHLLRQWVINCITYTPLWYIVPRRVRVWCFLNDGL